MKSVIESIYLNNDTLILFLNPNNKSDRKRDFLLDV